MTIEKLKKKIDKINYNNGSPVIEYRSRETKEDILNTIFAEWKYYDKIANDLKELYKEGLDT
jgi:hypothetical protein